MHSIVGLVDLQAGALAPPPKISALKIRRKIFSVSRILPKFLEKLAA